jgi:asparagine synthase (glutamine-hydrolysing)
MLMPAGKTGSLESVERVLGFVPGCLKVFAAQGQQRQDLFDAEFRARFAGRDSNRLFLDSLDVPAVLKGRDPLNKSLFVWAKSFLPNYILNLLGDRMEMAHSVEGRVPFLDHHVVECVCRAPVSLKIRGVTEKYLLREAAKPLITETVYRRQKRPFLSPPVTTVPTERFHQMSAGHTPQSRPRVAIVLRSEEGRRPARPIICDVRFGPYRVGSGVDVRCSARALFVSGSDWAVV